MERLISYILPTYNVEDYIEECLESLINQGISDEEYEIIVVNDGSADGTRGVVEKFQKENEKYKLILVDKENGGVSSARNVGLGYATGKYIWFVDPDDMIVPDCVKRLREYFIKEDNALFTLDAMRVCEEKFEAMQRREYDFTIDEKRKHEFVYCGPWIKILSRKYLIETGITFSEEMKYSEDILWSTQIDHHIKGFDKRYFVNGPIYCYRIRGNSALGEEKRKRGKDPTYYQQMIKLADEYGKMGKEYVMDDLDIITRRAKQAAIFSLCFLDKKYYKTEMKKLTNEGFYPYKFVWQNLRKGVSFKNTICKWLMFLLPCRWYTKLLNRILGGKK
jgi:glycosyltransferase involved in cell wall biosynthesis